MRSKCITLFSVIILNSLLILDNSFAAERELSSNQDARLVLENGYQCGKPITVTAHTDTADYFDHNIERVEKLLRQARMILSFECKQVSHINLIGKTQNIEIYKAEALKGSRWQAISYPAPLEGLAMLFANLEPDWFYAGVMYSELQRYIHLPGIKGTYQYDIYEKELLRMLNAVAISPEQFRQYILFPDKPLGSYENADKHYQDIVSLIHYFDENAAKGYREIINEEAPYLKDYYWMAQIEPITDKDKTFTQVIVSAIQLDQHFNKSEFTEYLDLQLSNLVIGEVNYLLSTMEQATLADLESSAYYLLGLPNDSSLVSFPKTKSAIHQLSLELVGEVDKRATEIQQQAQIDIVNEAFDYQELEAALVLGYQVAENFERAGFVKQQQAILAFTTARAKTLLLDGLPSFKAWLVALPTEHEVTEMLIAKARLFAQLSEDFIEYKAYQVAVEEKLEQQKLPLCKNMLNDAGAWSLDFKKTILVGSKQLNLLELSCDLYVHGHIVKDFSWEWSPGKYSLVIQSAEGDTFHLIFKAKESFYDQTIVIEQLVVEDKAMSYTEKEWQALFTSLTLAPPSGEPDEKGIRECDKLAGDRDDPKALVRGIDFDDENIEVKTLDRAFDACIAAVENAPDDARQQYQLARILMFNGELDAAQDYIKLAYAQKYPAAIYFQAQHLLSIADDNNGFVDALEMFAKAGKMGYQPGNDMVKTLNPDGIEFFRDIAPPSEQQVLNALSNKGKSADFMGVSASTKVVGAKIKECFQTSATDMSCEYKPVMQCAMSSGYGGAFQLFTNLMSSAMQASCNSEVYYTFGNFRRLKNGSWQQVKD
ncbi:hypothetical protein [Thalassotalea marina]|uniref:Tetratricopeptide repeat protein n=1 Tax=Thalassotalea marina TaxID=1673741 RepID=A0A919EMV1_9GAMM|nr:hypothetical protein [Thalassotalea marina]GHG04720.1 hypothetical protein GCM10017161_37900 [Thalassotalea marina]